MGDRRREKSGGEGLDSEWMWGLRIFVSYLRVDSDFELRFEEHAQTICMYYIVRGREMEKGL